jgi:hypothetical protein
MKKGLVFTFEALIALLFLSTILLSMNYENNNSLKELIIIEQENDFLKVWSIDLPSENEMVNDLNLLFNNYELYLDNKKMYSNGNGKNKMGREATILNGDLVERKVKIVVFYD